MTVRPAAPVCFEAANHAIEFVAEARQAVDREVKRPEGVSLEWTGQFEHEIRSRRTGLVELAVHDALALGIHAPTLVIAHHNESR